ncbi:Ribosomal LX protein [Methanococcus vannielii SB]|uniref:Large ribosomal subunit protein eL20 n=1 Tax=Methanococcus vannielii (strain ATCC 35089 / DSM 1224 / JCM 13029 / OCM 148 / SB) TaxID=406327 RepID=RL18A_METVS|nr:50S ribosomal protein L18Ae [Methanococcus vannielii]A6UR53.1 RecName: Full=Large ribosomal subunit protein eL20; AltName: Full=50S ribosomal protein L18Ae; AltName: Full=50S ribosomal protein L20e; AltName: Full=50S ribosomal protein LX [Methanococcus vannielii SB]ABR54975.1 Ribosomal LX protein [Methanococcus vannielii SB]
MAKIIRIKGKIVGKDEPMVFSKEYNVLKESDALEIMYSDMGSKHSVKRANIQVLEISEISQEEVLDPIVRKTLEMY